MTMGEYIKKLRLEHGWSQETLGKKVGVNRAAVQKWEKGSVENIKRSTIKQLAEVFHVSPCDLMQWDDETNIKKVQKEVNAAELLEQSFGADSLEAVNLFLKLDDADRRNIIRMMNGMLEEEKYSVQEGLLNA